MKSKELRAKRFKLIEDARALIAGDNPNAEQTDKFDAMMTEADGLKAQIDRIERAEELFNQENEALRASAGAQGISEDEAHALKDLENKTFDAYLRGGERRLTAQQRSIYEKRFQAAQSEGTPGEGGYTVPTGFYTRLIDAQKAYGGVFDVAYVLDTSIGNDLPIPTDDDTSNAGEILGENTPVNEQDVTFGSVTLNAFTYSSKMIRVSNQLLQDSVFDLNGFLAQKLGTRIARIVNTHCTTGDGSGKPRGVIFAATLGVTGLGTTAIAYADLIDLEHSVDPAYRKNARYMLSDSALKAAKKIVDGQQRPLWLAGLAVKEPDTINGYGYTVNQDMATVAAGHKPVAFGDFSNYFIRRVAGAQIMRLSERFADYNQTAFLAFQRWDGDLIDAGTNPVKYLQMAAS